VDLPEVEGCVGRVWDEHTCGVHHGSSADNRSVRGNPPDSRRMQAGRAEERSSTAPLVVGAADGPGRQRCNWIRRVMVGVSLTQRCGSRGIMRTIGLGIPRVLLPLFLVEITSVGYVAMAYCVCLSLALILVVKILGGGGTSSELW